MSALASQAARKKVVHQLDTPFSTVSWPDVSIEDQDTILELLCESKGKRAAQKEKEVKKIRGGLEQPPAPPMPELEANVDVGFNSITRNLQSWSSKNAESTEHESTRQYSMVFIARGNQTSAFNCHFPQMVGTASRNLPEDDQIRLVGFSKPCSERLSGCLGVPRVSSIAIVKDAPGAGALQEFITKTVAPVEIPWLNASSSTQYLAPKINAIETTVGPRRARVE
ncbi:rnase subunit pop3 [Fusarium longipes]|uniref:Rnase subunit pop3 n=1 Tax=Fusarium longipes TaxID=694270 RepID=A0A395T7Q3_9HYPO|nr:rnase subunit pop3 [Fusarium longipes]